ncbi:hypothetical protein ACTXT7_016294 [Hymenolepis weldensis]
MGLFKTPGSNPDLLTISKGICQLNGKDVGSPCEETEEKTIITFNDVPDYYVLRLTNPTNKYTVFFAKDCQFPTPNSGEVVVEKSIPLYRFPYGKTEENIVFALKGMNTETVVLYRDFEVECMWMNSGKSLSPCDNLIKDIANDQLIYNATISKRSDKNFESLEWGTVSDFITVTLDWDHKGEAPEVKACSLSNEPNRVGKLSVPRMIVAKEQFYLGDVRNQSLSSCYPSCSYNRPI